MKLASLNDGSRDGQLVVVSRDLSQAHFANGIASRLQQVLDDWNFISPPLEDLYTTLNQGKARHAFAFDPRQCLAPLPRAGQWVSGGAYRRAEGADTGAATSPRQLRGASDHFLGACAQAVFASEAAGIDCGAGLAAITGDVPQGADPEQALDGVRLLLLANTWTLREVEAAERALGAPPLHSQPATAFGPVAVTPDELGAAWAGGRVQAALEVQRNGRRLGRLDPSVDMAFHFGQLIAHLSRTRALRAGSLVGTGPVAGGDPAQGFACIADQRAVQAGEPQPTAAPIEWLRFGDTVRIELFNAQGHSVFGAIEQDVAAPATGE
ncbi:MAG: fumarylacetoacetate hydrolase family protein [Rubrivivax sp.]